MTHHIRSRQAGFSLVETVIAMGILATALLSLAGVFAMGMRHLASSTPNLLAREKAREAVESVHTARDTRLIRWAQINNVSRAGVFLDGAQPMYKPGTDGLVNTADDSLEGLEEQVQPGPDGLINTADDVRRSLATFTRRIEITDLFEINGQVNPTIRQLRVTINYQVGGYNRSYVLTTYISSIS